MGRDALLTRRIKAIDKKLAGLTPNNAEEPCIFKVHKQLFKINEKAYKPVLLAIGPYNDHGEVGQRLMEEHKLRYLKQMLKRRNENSVEAYISALTQLEERARNCYAERISLTTYEFVEMMLLDGCFIVELFRKYEMWNPLDKHDPIFLHDPIFQMSWMRMGIARDLMLFENQLPYFVLAKLFEMSASDQTPLPSSFIHSVEHIVDIEQNNEITYLGSSVSIDQSGQTRLCDLAISFFSVSLPLQDWAVEASSSYSTEKLFQLCQMHKAITPSLAKIVHEHLKVGDKFKNADFKHLLDLIHTMIIKLSVIDMELDYAIERQEVEVKYVMGEIFKHFFGLIPRVSLLLTKLKNMKMGGKEKSICCFIERLYGPKRIEDWNSIQPYGMELHDAGVKFEMAEKFRDKLKENEDWNSIPKSDAIAFQEAGVEFEKVEFFFNLRRQNRNEDDKKELCPTRFKMVEKFMRLLFLNKIEYWSSIPEGRELKEAGVEFKKAKKFRDTKDMIKSIPNATELKESGVKFKKGKQRNTFAIKFSNGVLEISSLTIEDETETFLRNLIAFEQYSEAYNDSSYVTDYMCFLDDLINSPKDVELLRRKEIIENWLGDDEVASTMVNKLGHHVTISKSSSIYAKTSIDMNRHCAKRWNEWKANLRHNYFNSPWTLLSVLAAILLLGLAITQTVFSIIY